MILILASILPNPILCYACVISFGPLIFASLPQKPAFSSFVLLDGVILLLGTALARFVSGNAAPPVILY